MNPGNFNTFDELQEFLDKGKDQRIQLHTESVPIQTERINKEAFVSANISADSFVSTKNYKRVIIEQGVPVTDRDINEGGEITAFNVSSIISDYIGSGPPTGSTGFFCTGTNANNDFSIGTGKLYVADSPKGGAVPNGVLLMSAGFAYSTQPAPSVGGVLTALPALTTPAGVRNDTAWLEVYEQDYGPLDDTFLYFNNPRTSQNTDISHRIKTMSVVRVWENSGAYSSLGITAITGAPFYVAGRSYYPLANISRTATAVISPASVTDLRPRINHAF